jgi:CRISPR-associated exonuclease Cas4
MAGDEEDYLMLSGIQHFAFCRRQWALIHIEQQWSDNVLTYEGQLLHEKADDPMIKESRGHRIISRAVPVVSHRLRVYGVADVVEFHRCVEEEGGISLPSRRGKWKPYPVEYKRGKPKPDKYDELQLCVQAMCLEEMLGVDIPEGALYYGEVGHRVRIELHDGMRKQAELLINEMHGLLHEGRTPEAVISPKCTRCSLREVCQPKLLGRRASEYLKRHMTAVEKEGIGHA